MNIKKVLPFLLLILMAALTIVIKRCNNNAELVNDTEKKSTPKPGKTERRTSAGSTTKSKTNPGLDRTEKKLFFTKHAKCRMKCRQITQQEVKDILANGEINYKKTELNDPRGPSYAVEGYTKDRQHVRIIFAPKQQHLTVVTVIDLEVEYTCNCS